MRVISDDGEILQEVGYENAFRACEAMDEVTGHGIFVQVIEDDRIYAEEHL